MDKVVETIARLKDITINERELINDWILITYDIPVTEEGKIARSKFLKNAPKIGAMMHSRSVYLMPNTQQSQLAAVELSATVGGEVYVWTSKVEDNKAKKITKFYDESIIKQINYLLNRIQKEEQLTLNGKHGMADRMQRKSANLYKQLLFAAAQRGVSKEVVNKLALIEAKLFGTLE